MCCFVGTASLAHPVLTAHLGKLHGLEQFPSIPGTGVLAVTWKSYARVAYGAVSVDILEAAQQ